LKLADGLAGIAFLDPKSGAERLFSAKFACPECGFNLEELEPRLFSFNNPKGACPDCDGLGLKQYFDASKIVHNSELSLASGAIRGWDRRHLYYYQLLSALARHY